MCWQKELFVKVRKEPDELHDQYVLVPLVHADKAFNNNCLCKALYLSGPAVVMTLFFICWKKSIIE